MASKAASIGYAFLQSDGLIDISSIDETAELVREGILEDCLGWRYHYPDRYPRNEAWERFSKTGSIVRVSISVVDD